MKGHDVGETVAFADYTRDVDALRKQLADAQATVEALQGQIVSLQQSVDVLNGAYESAVARAEALQAQLPAEMQECTILFKECEKGHGRLTATNWIDHGCQTCVVEALQRDEAITAHRNMVKQFDELQTLRDERDRLARRVKDLEGRFKLVGKYMANGRIQQAHDLAKDTVVAMYMTEAALTPAGGG